MAQKCRRMISCSTLRILAMLLISLSLCQVGHSYDYDYEISKLVKKLHHEDWEVRCSAARMLGDTKKESAIEPLISSLKDEDPDVRRQASTSLGLLGPPAFESLVPALRDSDWRVREGAARAFGHMHDVRSVSYLVAVLYDGGYWDVRWAAVEALMNMGNSAIKPLVRALKDNIDLVYGNYHFFIGKGLRETEDVLIDALSEYGDTRMAEDFLQCGNARLARFGAIWANKHGYIFSSVSNGRNGPHWGQSN